VIYVATPQYRGYASALHVAIAQRENQPRGCKNLRGDSVVGRDGGRMIGERKGVYRSWDAIIIGDRLSRWAGEGEGMHAMFVAHGARRKAKPKI